MNNAMNSKKIKNYAHVWSIGHKLSAALMLIIYLLIPLAHADPNKRDVGTNFHFKGKVVEIDIVENPRKFSFDETPTFEDGSPAYGGEFITQGFIYPKGTLEMGDGVDVDGNPQFPDLVIGTWFCRGWHI